MPLEKFKSWSAKKWFSKVVKRRDFLGRQMLNREKKGVLSESATDVIKLIDDVLQWRGAPGGGFDWSGGGMDGGSQNRQIWGDIN